MCNMTVYCNMCCDDHYIHEAIGNHYFDFLARVASYSKALLSYPCNQSVN